MIQFGCYERSPLIEPLGDRVNVSTSTIHRSSPPRPSCLLKWVQMQYPISLFQRMTDSLIESAPFLLSSWRGVKKAFVTCSALLTEQLRPNEHAIIQLSILKREQYFAWNRAKKREPLKTTLTSWQDIYDFFIKFAEEICLTVSSPSGSRECWIGFHCRRRCIPLRKFDALCWRQFDENAQTQRA